MTRNNNGGTPNKGAAVPAIHHDRHQDMTPIQRLGREVSDRLAREQGEREGRPPLVRGPAPAPRTPAPERNYGECQQWADDDGRTFELPSGDSPEAQIVRDFFNGVRPDNWPSDLPHPSGEPAPAPESVWSIGCPYCGEQHQHRSAGVQLSGCGRGRYLVGES